MTAPDDADRTIPPPGAADSARPSMDVTADSGVHADATALPRDASMDSKSWVGAAIGDARGAGAVPMGGRYKVLSQLGEGGFGVVYLADQTEPVRRRVALKVLKLALASPSMRARFEAEQQALAMMDHPGLAKVFDAGTTPDGQPYFAMEYAPGEPLAGFCDKRNLPIRTRLTLLAQICDAVHHAHMKGVIHRDLKPGNILVGETDEGYRPKVIDFGIAKAITGHAAAAPTETQFGQFLGTPVYMSPEQAEGGTIDIDTRADIYSLGVILYELLVGGTPIESETLRKSGLAKLHQTLLDTMAPRPSVRLAKVDDAKRGAITSVRSTDARTLARQLSRDLDWITMRCLEKDRTRRYESASTLAQDIRRYLNGEPVLAGPPGAGYRIDKFVRRHRVAVAAAALAVVGLVVFAVSMWTLWNAAEREGNRARATLDLILSSLNSSNVTGEQASAAVTVGDFLRHVDGEIGNKLANEPATASDLRFTIGSALVSLTDYATGERALASTLEYRQLRAADGGTEEQLALAEALHEHARALYFLRRYGEARTDYEKALAIRTEHLDPSHLLVGRTMGHLAATCTELHDDAAADRYFLDANERLRRAGEPGHRVLSGILRTRIEKLVAARRYDEAREMATQQIEVMKRGWPTEGVNNWRLGQLLSLLATIEVESGRLDLAVVHQRRAVELLKTRYPDHHATMTSSQLRLAKFLCQTATGSAAPEPGATVADPALLAESLALARAAADGLAKDGRTPMTHADALLLIGRIGELRGDREVALASAEQALKVLREGAPQAAAEIKAAQDLVGRLRIVPPASAAP